MYIIELKFERSFFGEQRHTIIPGENIEGMDFGYVR